MGKTSLARRFVQDKFDENQFATVGGTPGVLPNGAALSSSLLSFLLSSLFHRKRNFLHFILWWWAAAMHLHKVVESEGSKVLVEIWYVASLSPLVISYGLMD